MKGIFCIAECGELVTLENVKNDQGEPLKKRNITLRSLDNDEIIATAFGSAAQVPVAKGDCVAASVWMRVREYEGRRYQDASVREMRKLLVDPKF